MGLESKPWSSVPITAILIVDSVILASNSKLRAYGDALVIWDLGHVPRRIACWIAIVAALLPVLSAVEVSVEVQFLSRVVLIDQFSATLEVVDAVLD